MSSLHTAEAVALAVRARVLACTVAQGAETDLGLAVYQGRKHIDDSMPPCASILEAEDEVANGRVRDECEIGQRFVIFAYVPCTAENPNTAAHKAIRDLKRAMFSTGGKADTTLGGQVRRIDYEGRDIGPRADGALFVVAAIQIVVHYVERLSTP